MAAAKKITAFFFVSATGQEPVRGWLKDLARADRAIIGGDICTVELGWPIGMPVCRPLGKGLYEVRSILANRIARVLFAIEDGDMILLHGFIKKSQKTPAADLDIARKRLNEYRRQK
jgi:phage-related protein